MTKKTMKAGLTVAALGALAAAGPAQASITGGGVRAGKNVTVFHNIDFVAVFGHTVGGIVHIDVLRDGHRIAQSEGEAVETPEGGGLETNHGPAGAPVPGDCWEGYTPNLRPGDVIQVSSEGGMDEVTIDNIVADGPAVFNAGTGFVEFSGIAESFDGTPIDIAALDSAEVRNTSQFRGVPTATPGVIRDPARANGWIARWDPNQPMEREQAGHNSASRQAALLAGDFAMGFGHVAPPPLEAMLIDGDADTPGPAIGCEAAAPAADNAVGTSSVKTVNIAHLAGLANGTDVALTLGGSVADGAGAPTIVLSDGTNSVTDTATAGGPAGAPQGWTATFSKTQLAGLADGDLTASIQGAGGITRTIVKDTVAPTIGTDVAPGTYTGTQNVALQWTGANAVTYTVDGAPATESDKLYVGTPIQLGTGTHTIRALAVDAAGNRTAATFEYVIDPAPAAAAPAVAPAPVIQRPVAPVTVARPSLQVRGLAMPKRVRSRTARRSGLRARMRLARGTRVVRLSLYRKVGGELELVGRVTRFPSRSGDYVARLNSKALRSKLRPGLYVLTATPGASSRTLDADDEQSRTIRIIR